MKRKLISMLLALCVIMSCFAVSGISVSAATANDDTAAGTITVYFTDALNWGSANVYYWNNGPAWPGTAMTVKETNSYGQKVYRATIPANVEGIIFNSNGNQTVDIKTNIYNGSQWYTVNQKNGNNYMVNYVSGSGTPATQETTAPATQATTTPATGEDTSKHMYVSLGAMPATNQYGCWTWNDGEEGVFAYVQKFQYAGMIYIRRKSPQTLRLSVL